MPTLRQEITYSPTARVASISSETVYPSKPKPTPSRRAGPTGPCARTSRSEREVHPIMSDNEAKRERGGTRPAEGCQTMKTSRRPHPIDPAAAVQDMHATARPVDEQGIQPP